MDWTHLKALIPHLLCPPGEGVYTVFTAREKKQYVQEALYGTGGNVLSRWQESFNQLPLSPAPLMLGVCSDSGGGILRGANWGPLALRETLLRKSQKPAFFDLGDVRVIPHLLHDKYLNTATLASCREALFQDKASELPVSPLSLTEFFLKQLYHIFPDKKLLGLGGDHSVSYPLVKEYLRSRKKTAAVIHFDAHTDLLQERLGIDLNFGSWAYHILPYLNSPDLLIQVGIRASGKPKEHWEQTYGIKQYWAQEVLGAQAPNVAEEIVQHLQQKKVDEIYVSFDIDAMDISYASATGTPETGGLTPYEPMCLLQELIEHFPLTGADLVEVAPFIRHADPTLKHEPEQTLEVATALIEFFLQALQK